MPEKNRYFTIRRSKIAGRGAFAIRKIRKGTRVAEYTGEVITDAESDRRYPDDDKQDRHHTFLFDIGWGKCIDATHGGSDSRYINHSCDPNCEATVEKRRVFIDAVRTIEPGEELFYDYQYARNGESDAYARRVYPCHCGSENCRGTIMVAAPRKRKKKAVRKKSVKKKGARKGGGRKKGAKKGAVRKRGANKGAPRKKGAGKRGATKKKRRS